jgi:hypothetical protein
MIDESRICAAYTELALLIDPMPFRLIPSSFSFDLPHLLARQTVFRPTCSEVQRALLGMAIRDDCPSAMPMIDPKALRVSTIINLEPARSVLIFISSPDQASIPERLDRSLSWLVRDVPRRRATEIAAKKNNSDDIQTFVDFVDLVGLHSLPSRFFSDPSLCQALSGRPMHESDHLQFLIYNVKKSTHIFPRFYELSRLQYDSVPIAESVFGKAYRGVGLNARVNVVTNSNCVAVCFVLSPSHISFVQF